MQGEELNKARERNRDQTHVSGNERIGNQIQGEKTGFKGNKTSKTPQTQRFSIQDHDTLNLCCKELRQKGVHRSTAHA